MIQYNKKNILTQFTKVLHCATYLYKFVAHEYTLSIQSAGKAAIIKQGIRSQKHHTTAYFPFLCFVQFRKTNCRALAKHEIRSTIASTIK